MSDIRNKISEEIDSKEEKFKSLNQSQMEIFSKLRDLNLKLESMFKSVRTDSSSNAEMHINVNKVIVPKDQPANIDEIKNQTAILNRKISDFNKKVKEYRKMKKDCLERHKQLSVEVQRMESKGDHINQVIKGSHFKYLSEYPYISLKNLRFFLTSSVEAFKLIAPRLNQNGKEVLYAASYSLIDTCVIDGARLFS